MNILGARIGEPRRWRAGAGNAVTHAPDGPEIPLSHGRTLRLPGRGAIMLPSGLDADGQHHPGLIREQGELHEVGRECWRQRVPQLVGAGTLNCIEHGGDFAAQ